VFVLRLGKRRRKDVSTRRATGRNRFDERTARGRTNARRDPEPRARRETRNKNKQREETKTPFATHARTNKFKNIPVSSHSNMFGAEFFSHHGSFGLILALATIVAPRVVDRDVDARALAGGAARCAIVVVTFVVVIASAVVVLRASASPRASVPARVPLSFALKSSVSPAARVFVCTNSV